MTNRGADQTAQAGLPLCCTRQQSQVTVDSEIFARILFSRIALKDVLVM